MTSPTASPACSAGLRGAISATAGEFAEGLADAVTTGEVVHLLLAEIADPHAEPRPRPCLRRPRQQQHEREGPHRPREACHSRPPFSSFTRRSTASATVVTRAPTSIVS